MTIQQEGVFSLTGAVTLINDPVITLTEQRSQGIQSWSN